MHICGLGMRVSRDVANKLVDVNMGIARIRIAHER